MLLLRGYHWCDNWAGLVVADRFGRSWHIDGSHCNGRGLGGLIGCPLERSVGRGDWTNRA